MTKGASVTVVMALVLSSTLATTAAPAADQRRCMVHDHQPLQVRRMPFAPASTSKPRNPLEDEAIHCEHLRPVARPSPSPRILKR